MKNIDVKSLIIGALLTSSIFLGVAATSPTDKWDKKQVWQVSMTADPNNKPDGWEPFAASHSADGVPKKYILRRRIK